MKRFFRQSYNLLSVPTRNKITFNLVEGGKTHKVEGEQGRNLMRALSKTVNKDLEDEVFGICGGNLDCGSCLVYVPDYKATGVPEDDELTLLKGLKEYKPDKSRCSCQLYVEKNFENFTFELPESIVKDRKKQLG